MNNEAFNKLRWILVLMLIFALLTINHWYIDEQLKVTNKQITDTQDRIKSLNSQLSKWTNESNMILEAKKLKLRNMEAGEVIILENENDS